MSRKTGADPRPPDQQATRQQQEAHRDLLTGLVCPLTGGPLVYHRKGQELVSVSARIAFPIRDGIPIMIGDEARELNEKEVTELTARRDFPKT